jgi:Ni,Fe-hydrogenase III small subunit
MEEDERVQLRDIQVLHAEGSCTGCRNGVLSSLFDMIRAGTIERARGMCIVTGGALPPSGTPEDRVVPVGVCCPEELKALARYVKGCPPNNVDIVEAILRAL